MQKIPTMFVRSKDRPQFVTDERVPECAWAFDGEGVATRKWDGTCCAVIGGKLYKRIDWDAAKGPAPECWLHHDFNPAQRSGHGWFPVGDGPEDWMHRAASSALATLPDGTYELCGPKVGRNPEHLDSYLPDGTYELCGPKVGRNPEHLDSYVLIPHGTEILDAPRTFAELRDYLDGLDIEGIVWHQGDGRMAKIKLRDFGIQRPRRTQEPPR